MTAPLVLPSLLLALVLAVSAAFKLRDPSTTADAFASLRLPEELRAHGIPSLLPYAELVLALGLLLVPSPVYVAVTTIVVALFIAYLVVVARALGFEEKVDCGCFGRLGLGEIDNRTVIRNALLVLLALVAVGDAFAGRSVIHRLASFGATEWLWLLGVGVAIVVTWLVVGHTTTAATSVTAPVAADEVDELDYQRQPIPYGALHDPVDDEPVSLFAAGAGRPALLVFVNQNCGSCVRTMELLPQWAERHTIVRTIAVPPGEGFAELPELGPHVTWLEDPATTVARTFGVSYPSAVLLGIDGMLAGGPESGFDAISDFLDEISQQLADAGVAADSEPVVHDEGPVPAQ